MDSRKFLLVICAVLAVVFFVLCASIVQQQGRPARGVRAAAQAPGAARQAMGGSAGAGNGMLDRVMGSYVDRVAGPRDPSSPAGADAAQAATGASGTGADAAARPGTGDEGGGPSDEEKARLRLVHMKDRAQGERRMFGAGGDSSSAALAARRSGAFASGARSEQEEEAQVLDKLKSFVDKLHQRAAGRGGADEQAPGRGGPDGQGQASRVTIMSVDGFKGDKPPTLKLLEKVNEDGANSLMMTANPELEDGSKDRHGKKFDGNSVTFETIPIDEVNGAFGGKEIRANNGASVNTNGGAADLKH